MANYDGSNENGSVEQNEEDILVASDGGEILTDGGTKTRDEDVENPESIYNGLDEEETLWEKTIELARLARHHDQQNDDQKRSGSLAGKAIENLRELLGSHLDEPEGIFIDPYDGSEFSMENIEEWDPIEGPGYPAGEVFAEAGFVSGNGPASTWGLEEDDLDEVCADVHYGDSSIDLGINVEGEEVGAGMRASLTPQQAETLAAVLLRASIEFQRRPRKQEDAE